MKKNKFYSDYDHSTVVTILVCLTVIAVGCVLGIAYLFQYGFYGSGDNGGTAKSVAVQQYTLDDIEQARDYYACLIETNDEYRINYYKTRFSPEETNFIFTITDFAGKVLFSNSPTDIEYSEGDLGYSGSSDFMLYDESGGIAPMKLKYSIVVNEELQASDKYQQAFRWIELADSLKYVLFLVLAAVVIAIVILLSLVTINAGTSNEETGEVIPGLIDRLPIELCAAFLIVTLIATWIVIGLTAAADVGMVLNNVIIVIACVVIMLVLMAFLSTLSVRVKLGKLYKSLLVYRIYRKIKRRTPREKRKNKGENKLFRNLMLGISTYILVEVVILSVMAYLTIIDDSADKTVVFEIFLALWALTRLIIIPVIAMIAINLHYVKEEGQKLAEGVLGDDIASKLSISSIRAHGRNLDLIRKEINKAMEQELKTEKLKNELLANVSHDIKTPLTSISSFAELLEREDLTQEQRIEYAGVLKRHTRKLADLVNELIEASQINAGTWKVNLEKASLNITLTQAVEEFMYNFDKCGILPRMSLPQKELFVMCDGESMWRLLSNIFSNVCKYALKGSDVNVALYEDGKKAVIKVTNLTETTEDIDGETLLGRFVRATEEGNTDGHGLGLSIAKSLAEMQGGTFGVSCVGGVFSAVLEFDII